MERNKRMMRRRRRNVAVAAVCLLAAIVMERSTAIMEGECTASSLNSGQQRPYGSYLCYPPSSPIYKFGLNSAYQLSFYAYDTLVWSATPPLPDTIACQVFGNCTVAISFFRLQNSGSIAGYDASRNKVWDSHAHGGSYRPLDGVTDEDNVKADKLARSTLTLGDDGVLVQKDGVLTWAVQAPLWDPPTYNPTNNPTTNPTNTPTNYPSNTPTNKPTNKPTDRPTQEPTLLPTSLPTAPPTSLPTALPTNPPVTDPTSSPRSNPTQLPTYFPSLSPTFRPTKDPSSRPTNKPTKDPTTRPTNKPTNRPSNAATNAITDAPTDAVTDALTAAPSNTITEEPTILTLTPTYSLSTMEPTNTNSAILGSIQGFVWDDTNTNDGVFNSPDPALPRIPISLHRCAPSNPALDDLYLLATETSEDGTYRFDNLPPGSYRLRFAGNHQFVTKKVHANDDDEDGNSNGTGGTIDSDANPDGSTDCIILSSGNMQHNAYVGLLLPPAGVSVQGQIFIDWNGNGRYDPGEEMRDRNMVVDLFDCDNTDKWIDLTRTNSTGHYQFIISDGQGGDTTDITRLLTQLNVQTFRALFTGLPAGYQFTQRVNPQDQTNDSIYNHANPENGWTDCWDLERDGQGIIHWYAGITPINVPTTNSPTTNSPTTSPPTTNTPTLSTDIPTQYTDMPTQLSSFISGYAFLDTNNDGIMDQDTAIEPPLADVNVRLFSCTGRKQLVAVSRTNSSGVFGFPGLSAGTYRVDTQEPVGYDFSSAWVDLNNDAADDNNVKSHIDPDSGSTPCFNLLDHQEVHIGLTLETPTLPTSSPAPSLNTPVTVAGFVFYDDNDNGILDPEEQPMSSIRIALFDCNGTIFQVTDTDNNGLYGFTQVQPGQYLVKFSLPQNHQLSTIWSYNNPDVDSDADPQTGSTVCRTFRRGDEDYTIAAGMYESTTSSALPNNRTNTDAPAPTISPTDKPTDDPKGDGTPCSGSPCPMDNTCRNKAGICGSGLAFCNDRSVWTPNCPSQPDDDEDILLLLPNTTIIPTILPSMMPSTLPSLLPSTQPTSSISPTSSASPSFMPSSSSQPTSSSFPTDLPSISPSLHPSLLPSSSPSLSPTRLPTLTTICNDDGSFGTNQSNNSNNNSGTQVTFTYALQSLTGKPVVEMIDQVEQQLNHRMACHYFDDPCMNCQSLKQRQRQRQLRQQHYQQQYQRQLQQSILQGLSSSPPDEVSFEACYSPSPDCRVINGIFTSYFPPETDPDTIQNEIDQLLNVVNDELSKDDWDGMTLTYANAPRSQPPPPSKGTSIGVIIGATVGGAALLAIIAVVSIILVRRKRNKDDLQRILLPYGDADSLDSKDDDSDSDVSSSSSEEDEQSSGHNSSAVSGDTFPTNAAQAQPKDMDDDSSTSSSSGSSSSDSSSSSSEGPLGAFEDARQSSDDDVYVNDDDDLGYEHELDNRDFINNRNAAAAAAIRNANMNSNINPNMNNRNANMNSNINPNMNNRNVNMNSNMNSNMNNRNANMNSNMNTSMNTSMNSNMNTSMNSSVNSMNSSMNSMNSSMNSMNSNRNSNPNINPNNRNTNSRNTNNRNTNDEYPHHPPSSSGYVGETGYVGDIVDDQEYDYYRRKSMNSQGSDHSANSADPPGTSYRDLPRAEYTDEWENMPAPPQTQRTYDDTYDKNYEDTFNDNYIENYDKEYDNDNYDKEFEKNFDKEDRGSATSRGSRESRGAPRYSEGSDYDYDNYNYDQYDDQYDDPQYNYDNYNYDDQYDGQYDDPQYDAKYDNYEDNEYQDDYQDEYQDEYQEEYQDGYQDEYKSHSARKFSSGSYDKRSDEYEDDDSYGRGRPVTTPVHSARSSYHDDEELEEDVDDATYQVANTSNTLSNSLTKTLSNTSTNSNAEQKERDIIPQENYGEEEESINNIFKSLSEIQSRLANKNKSSQDAPPSTDIPRRNPSNKIIPYQSTRVSPHRPKTGIVVEDASVDGSQVSNFVTNPARNRRPQKGQWMEPVDEHND